MGHTVDDHHDEIPNRKQAFSSDVEAPVRAVVEDGMAESVLRVIAVRYVVSNKQADAPSLVRIKP